MKKIFVLLLLTVATSATIVSEKVTFPESHAEEAKDNTGPSKKTKCGDGYYVDCLNENTTKCTTERCI